MQRRHGPRHAALLLHATVALATALLLAHQSSCGYDGVWGELKINHNGTVVVTVANLTNGTMGTPTVLCSSGGGSGPDHQLCGDLAGDWDTRWPQLCGGCYHHNTTVDVMVTRNNGTCGMDSGGGKLDVRFPDGTSGSASCGFGSDFDDYGDSGSGGGDYEPIDLGGNDCASSGNHTLPGAEDGLQSWTGNLTSVLCSL
ncbi:hypothetical protein EMCLV014L [Equine molluscum contagiosum-like virus]|nr:hypothetical protein EMCLV014L [Equine molluscum contagiosum-like virus]